MQASALMHKEIRGHKGRLQLALVSSAGARASEDSTSVQHGGERGNQLWN